MERARVREGAGMRRNWEEREVGHWEVQRSYGGDCEGAGWSGRQGTLRHGRYSEVAEGIAKERDGTRGEGAKPGEVPESTIKNFSRSDSKSSS